MRYYIAEKTIAEIKEKLAPSSAAPKAEAVVQKGVAEIPISVPTIPYYNSMGLNMRLNADGNQPVTISDQSCAFNVIIVVGAGGTGGFLIRDLARYVATLPYSKTTLMIVMDQDEVEHKNLVRQNFIIKDVGKNKAEVMANRYGNAFGVKIVHIPRHLTEGNISEIISPKFCRDVIVQHLCNGVHPAIAVSVNLIIASCVDNNKTRALISRQLGLVREPVLYANESSKIAESNKFFYGQGDGNCQLASMTWIDSGNESHSGQVICYYDTQFTNKLYMTGSKQGIDSSSNGCNPGRMVDVDQRWQKNPAQWLYSYLTSPLDVSKLPEIRQASSFRVKAGVTIDELTTKAAKLWMLHHQMGNSNIKTHAEYMKPFKQMNPLEKDFEAQAKYIVGRSIRDLSPLGQTLTFPITYVYPRIWDQAVDKLNTEMSCAERAVIDPQNIMVNIQAASYMMNYLSKILASNPKHAMLSSFGCAWNNSACKEFYMTESTVKDIFTGMIKELRPTLDSSVTAFKMTKVKHQSSEINVVTSV